MPGPSPQPYLHDDVSCVCAPTVALSSKDGQIRPSGAQGVFHRDSRVLSELVVDVDHREPVAVEHRLVDADQASFVGVIPHVGDPGQSPSVQLVRERRAAPAGMQERLVLVNKARESISVTIRARVRVDFASVVDVKRGRVSAVGPSSSGEAGLTWVNDDTQVAVRASGEPAVAEQTFTWQVTVGARARWEADLTLKVTERVSVPNVFLPASSRPDWNAVSVGGPADLRKLTLRGVRDIAALTLADPDAPEDVFVAAGSPWFFTLFGRDSIWAARLTLPIGTDLARGTLRTLARRQGIRHDHETAEAPGKILHEVRRSSVHHGLPPVYFGTVDATALWVCLLHDAWAWGLPADDVAALLDTLEAAVSWLLGDADSDGDGFIEYIDHSGRGLANQGWKDSEDAIQFPDGSLADSPIALSEVQAYAYQAARSAASLLDAFGRPGAARARSWAEALRSRFRDAFWVADARGRYPAVALDGAKTPVPTATSNLGHLLGTGLLDVAEASAVAARLHETDLDSGYGLRTMSADAAGFDPLGYHTGAVWPHDTAIAVNGLVADGHSDVAAALAFGLLRASPAFDHRLPELFAGADAHSNEPVLAYPTACSPQAWSATVPVALIRAALGLTADVPNGTLHVQPNEAFAAWFPLRVAGLEVAGHALTVSVDSGGKAQVDTDAPLDLDVIQP